ncbi:hypothetical protein [Streptomyces sp. B8F3]|uniref:hypothetical protein n=1 Tax=unclassified Streptomyces TaxID=2593676 RepID=UPI00325EDF1A
MKKRLLSLSAGAALAMGVVTGVTGTANAAPAPEAQSSQTTTAAKAWPKDCSYDYYKDVLGSEGAQAYCGSGGGYFKAAVNCKPITGGPIVYRLAPVWQKAGGSKHSYVYCPGMTVFSSAGIMTKAG